MTDKLVIFSTRAKADHAERLTRALVTGQLAACVSVIPQVRSHWLGINLLGTPE